MTPEELKTKLLSRVVVEAGPLETPCWLWPGAQSLGGYGRINIGPGVRVQAHRLAWELYVGPIPTDLIVLHRCDQPPCCNPEHLQLGTQQDNVDDCVAKGRRVDFRGEQVGNSKLTEEKAAFIKWFLEEKKHSGIELAQKFGVSNRTISAIKHGWAWTHVAPLQPPPVPPTTSPFRRRLGDPARFQLRRLGA
jgi:HNH endonuclease